MGIDHNEAADVRAIAVAPSAELRTVTVRDFDGLAPHRAAWDRLAWSAPQQVANLLPSWVEAFLRHRLKPREKWFCSFAYRGDALVGVLPAVVAPHPVLGRFRPLLSTPFDALTPSGDLLLDPAHAELALQALLAEARAAEPAHLGLALRAVRRSSPLWGALTAAGGDHVRHGLRARFSFLDVSGDAETYFASLGNLRRNLKRYRKKLDGRGAVTVEMRRGVAPGDPFRDEFLALEAAGWKGRNDTALLNHPGALAFYIALLDNIAATGRLEWQGIRLDGRLVAAGMGIRCGRSLMLPKIAFDEDYTDCMPGNLLSAEVIRDGFARSDVDEINHMSNAAWHQFWRMDSDDYTDIHLVRPGLVPILFQLSRVGATAFYQDHIRPRIPAALKAAHRKFRRRGDRKPRRAAETRTADPLRTSAGNRS
nr:GNAT family N-acetyltransferase [Microvirga antarctica]